MPDSDFPAPGPDPDPRRRRLHHIRPAALSEDTAQSASMVRREAISGKAVGSSRLWMGQTHMAPGTRSADHHHGLSETAIYVVSGHPRFVFLDETGEAAIDTNPGDYVFVPPWVAHREENPSTTEEAVVVIARSSQEAVVVNLAGLGGS